MTAVDSVPLPGPTALCAALETGDEEECQKLMIRVLGYGTGSSSSGKNSSGQDSLSKRIEETVKWFEKSMEKIANTKTDPLPSSHLEKIEDALVDCLWLLGSTLTSLPWTDPTAAASSSPSKTTAGGTDAPPSSSQAFHPSVRALIVIVRALLSASFWESSSTGASARFARKLQENWFPVLLERVDAVKLTTTATTQAKKDEGISGTADDLMKRLRQYNTATNYKLQKYNLLQEESEGYSKVLQYLCGSPGGKARNESNRDRSYLWKLVGTFELDPNRVLDLSLDVLEARLQASDAVKRKTADSGSSKPPILADESDIRWLLGLIKDCSTDKLPALLRFKLRHEKKPALASSFLPETIALLVREGAMDLRTFVEDYFEATLGSNIERAYCIFRKKDRDRVLALSRVSLSGNTNKENPKQIEMGNRLKVAIQKLGLQTTSNGNGSKDFEETENNDEVDGSNGQILSLLLILIRWGEWDRVKPFLSSATSSSYSLSSPTLSLWSKLCCLVPETFGSALMDVAEARIQSASIIAGSVAPKLNHVGATSSSSPSGALITEEGDSESTISTMTDLIHFVRSISDILSLIIPSGCIGSRPVLYCNLCRLLRSILTNITTESKDDIIYSLPQEVFSFFDSFLVPSLSLFPSNPAISTELWSVLKLLPYDIRYKLYEGWKGSGLEKLGLVGGGTKPLPNVESEMVAGKATRYSLKRLSKDNIRDMSRQLAKVTHSNPLVVFATILSQIESYDNMVEVMVEAQRFVNPLGLDVLGHCVLGRLSGTSGGVNRSRLKEDGVHVSQWLQSLETFAGEFYKTRPSVEFRGILSYLIERLEGGNVMELGMLRTLLKVAGGYGFADYSPAASLNETLLDGRSGSKTLKRETMSFGVVDKTNPLAIDHVRSVLQTDGMGISLLILIAQARDRIIFDSGKGAPKEVKLVGNLYDTCQVVMSILLEFLTDGDNEDTSDNNRISVYSRFLPSFQDLRCHYGLDMATAWHLCRPCMKAVQKMEPEDLEKSALNRFVLSEDVRKSYSNSLPESVWKVLTPKLFEFFNITSLGDITCPESVYTSEISRVDKEIERIQGLKPSVPRSESLELERLKDVSKRLDGDMKKQKEDVESTLKRLNEEKIDFFTSEEMSCEAARAFLMYCIYPRTSQSPDDAMYCAAIAFRLHRIWTPGFSIMHYLDELISIVSGALFGVTEAEAANIAILLWQTLNIVNDWRHKDGLYDKEVLGKPGSSMESTEDGETSTKPVSHKDFIELYNNWQYSLADVLVGCLQSTEYIHTRTGLVVLSRLLNVFPTGPTVGNRLLKALEPLRDESSSRPDIRASANAYRMMLVKARDDGKWVEEDEGAAKARADKEKEAAEERKKKVEQSFQELKRDNEKITAQIGNDDRRDRDRRVGPRDNQDRRMDHSRQGGGRGTPGSNRTGNDNSRTENGRDRRGDDRDRRPNRDGDWSSARDRDDDTKDDRGRVGRRGGGGDGDDDRRGSNNRGDGDRGGGGRDDGRLRRGDQGGSRNPKRSRPSSPIDDADADRSNNPKRARNDEYNNYPARRSGGASRSPDPPPSRPIRSSRRTTNRR